MITSPPPPQKTITCIYIVVILWLENNVSSDVSKPWRHILYVEFPLRVGRVHHRGVGTNAFAPSVRRFKHDTLLIDVVNGEQDKNLDQV